MRNRMRLLTRLYKWMRRCCVPYQIFRSRQSRALVFLLAGFSPMPKIRVSTRMTLPSRIGVG